MNICEGDPNNKHEAIVYEERECPLCSITDKIEAAQKEVNEAAESIQSKRDEMNTKLEVVRKRMKDAANGDNTHFEFAVKMVPVLTISEVIDMVSVLEDAYGELDSITIDG